MKEFRYAYINREDYEESQQAKLDALATEGWEIAGVSRGEYSDRLYLQRERPLGFAIAARLPLLREAA